MTLPLPHTWVLTKPIGADVQNVVGERNPYYWKVDTQGNQLPYTDGVTVPQWDNPQVITLKTLNGEIDFQFHAQVTTLENKPLMYKNQKKGNYHLIDIDFAFQNDTAIALNLTDKDPVKRKVLSDKDFRIGLSHAINRQEVIDIVFQGQGQPYQCGPRPESPFYHEQLARQYTEYDVKKANQYLDKVLPEKDSKGMRLGPDGKPFFFQIEVITKQALPTESLQIVSKHWKAVGIDMKVKTEAGDLWTTRAGGNEHDAGARLGADGLAVLMAPQYYFPYNGASPWAIPWANWYQHGGLQGKLDVKTAKFPIEEPPESAKKQMRLYDKINTTADPKEQLALMKQILQIAADEFWVMGINLPVKHYGVVTNRLRNTPSNMLDSFQYPSPAPTNLCQYFIEQT